MKTKFTKEYLLSNKGCYEREQVIELPFIDDKNITIYKLFKHIPIKDFSWFLLNKCDLTLKEKRLFSLHRARQVEVIFNNMYPNDSRISDCNNATEKYIKGLISLEELIKYRTDAADAAAADAAAYAAAAAAAAADAAYAAAAAAAAAADAAYADAAYAADAAATYNSKEYKKSIWKFVKSLMVNYETN